MVFIESKYVLLKKFLEDSDFAGLNLVVASKKEKTAYTIILHFYKLNI